ncbi:Putative 2-aminoethylphosphonate import ATP-binding protein PhnT [Pontivivens insulae]|uniref:2-aminoethylphosphonate import ATP-binding protein PhnT n=2 Tax=Pontivivens insulae TaxID=1639689 RepID=A0A2R8A9B0_9RHOB|nr:putative thiamine transport system ATP-binding protein [Pontivivens insulae]SPF28640.1 Putative 2-aminoethylphosphonate import ATP-binding protein PhnT [Pontivivens insulae]
MMDKARGLTLDHLTLSKGTETLLSVDAHVAPGDVLSVMGPSGSGKSTLLSALIGTLAPAFAMQGRILLDGEDLAGKPPEARRIGLLFQDAMLFPHLSVGENLAFGLSPDVRGRVARRQVVEEGLIEIGLEGFAPRDPATLSGGQRARVALMRTLLARPRALLLDEPFSRLDTDRRASIRSLVLERARKERLPVILVTHDEADAQAAGGRVVRIGQE